MFRTRQAPSPTGYVHLGSVRQMLFTALIAKINNGIWYLRVEDTDQNRLVPDAVTSMLKTLEQLHLKPQEGPTLEQIGKADTVYHVYQNGTFGPYIQSQRLEIYHTYVNQLIEKGLAYWCYLTDQERDELREIKQSTRTPIDYYQANINKGITSELTLSFKMVQKLESTKPVLRYKLKRAEILECTDELMGKVSFDLSLEEDFILLKSDGFPTYHFAHVIDDQLMQTTLVIRGQEWFPSMAKHVTMFRDVFGKEPQYLHLPVILGTTGNKKLSKRDGGVNVQTDYLEQGILPEALLNYLAFLGWNPGTEQELYLEKADFQLPQEQRIQKLLSNLAVDFSLQTLTKTSARFNMDKLLWFNREYIKMMTLDEYLQLRFKEQVPEYSEHYILDKNRATTLIEDPQEAAVIDQWMAPEKELLISKQVNIEQAMVLLEQLKTVLIYDKDDLQNKSFDERVAHWDNKIKSWLADQKVEKFGPWLSTLRLALSGKKQSPSPFEIAALITEEEVARRINLVISILKS
jgi:glutamyl-tRNA synthetase